MGGNFYDSRKKLFNDTNLQGQAGDMLYMSTDGFADQFGGPDKRRFMTRQLKEMLIEASAEELPQQHSHIDQAHLRWRGNLGQTDDILVMGIKL